MTPIFWLKEGSAGKLQDSIIQEWQGITMRSASSPQALDHTLLPHQTENSGIVTRVEKSRKNSNPQ